ncbi:MAG TPA: ABC transporter permease [Mycobacteriales bacterium]|nr:ABC transporter permease [Mycobacteriales bacterium]
MIWANLALAGLGIGSIAALSGIGLLVTYQATGVFNLAHGAIAMIVAYLLWQLVEGWHVPIGVAAPLVLLVIAPGVGILADRAVFRPLQRRAAQPAEKLVASLGIFVLLTGIAFEVWHGQARRAPAIVPITAYRVGGLVLHVDALADLALVLLVTAALTVVARGTRLGTQIRAVVDRRDLAELSAVNADRVSAIGWAAGSTLAGLTGVLLAPRFQLTPFNLTLLVLEIFAVPVVARLSSLPVAIGSALALGTGLSVLSHVSVGPAAVQTVLRTLTSDGFIVALLLALLLLRRLREVGSLDAGTTTTFASRRTVRKSAQRRAVEYGGAAVLLLTPLMFSALDLRSAQEVPALAVVFLSIVAVTGYSGQISLGQAGYAGLGALFVGIFTSQGAPELGALFAAMVAGGIVGLLTGYLAISRRGLFLALTTFAVGGVVERFVFQNPAATSGVQVSRPNLFGLSLSGDRAFYLFELCCLALVLLLVRNLRTGRLGRALIALRDSEDGARSVGINLRVLKLAIFTVSSSIAGLGGALLAQTAHAFDPDQFDPLQSSLPWFTAVLVFGADSAAGAVAAAGFAVTVNTLAGNDQAYTVAIGGLALVLTRMPGGVTEALRRAVAFLGRPTPWMARLARESGPPPARAQLSARGRALLARARR